MRNVERSRNESIKEAFYCSSCKEYWHHFFFLNSHKDRIESTFYPFLIVDLVGQLRKEIKGRG